MIRDLVLYLLAATPLRRTCAREHCGCGEYVHAQRAILLHIGRSASVIDLLEARRQYLVDRIDTLQRSLSLAGGAH